MIRIAPVHPAPKLRLLETFAEAEAVWRRLESETPTFPFQCYDWVSQWHRCVGAAEGVVPTLVLVEGPDGEAWMLLPLGIRPGGLGRVLTWLGGELSDYLGPLIAVGCPEALLTYEFPELWQAIVETVPPFTYAHLERQPERIGGRNNPMRWLNWRENPSTSHHTVLASDWQAYYHSKSSPRTRQTDRRKQRRIEDHGDVVFEIATSNHAPDLLAVMFAQKSSSYQELGVKDLFADERNRRFVERLTFSAGGTVHLSCLRIGGRVLATHWGILHHRRFYSLLPTYERGDLAQHSPGALLRLRLLQWACENNVEIFDFTVGDEAYKDRWCEVAMPLYDALVPASAWGQVCTTAVHSWRALKRTVKSSPTLFPALVRLRAFVLGRRLVNREDREDAAPEQAVPVPVPVDR